jgi:hypothetical protein
LKTRRATPAASEPEINWTNLSRQDKEVFFSWLDEFFKVKDASQTTDQSVVRGDFLLSMSFKLKLLMSSMELAQALGLTSAVCNFNFP